MADAISECSHTPGPWTYRNEADREEVWIGVAGQSIGMMVIATVQYGFTPPANLQQQANARLIAAAPDLLEAAKEWLRLHEQGMKSREAAVEMWGSGKVPRAMESLRAAITKAEGRS